MTEVSQADRDAACGLTGGQYWNEVKRGKRDGDQLVQAFARHRIAERERVVGEIVAWLATKDNYDFDDLAIDIEAKFGKPNA